MTPQMRFDYLNHFRTGREILDTNYTKVTDSNSIIRSATNGTVIVRYR